MEDLIKRIEILEQKVDSLSKEHRNHEWEYQGGHFERDKERKCIICNRHEKYVYPMKTYEDVWVVKND